MRSAFAASVRFLAEFLWVIAKVILWLIALGVVLILLSLLFGPFLDTTIGAGLFLLAFGVVVILLIRRLSGKMVRIRFGGPESEAHNVELRQTVQEELTRHRSEPPAPHP